MEAVFLQREKRREEDPMVFWKALCIAVIIFAAFCPAPSFGADAKALLSEANTLFRNADKDFMSGKMDSAWETVQKAKEAISAAREPQTTLGPQPSVSNDAAPTRSPSNLR